MAEAAPQTEEYAVSEACIACDACCDDFPEVFKMNSDHTRAIAFAPAAKGKFDPWDIIYDCPVDAISLIRGDLPPPPEGKKKKSAEAEPMDTGPIEDTRPWDVRWEEALARGPESAWARMKRYGLASSLDETPGQYHIRLALPDRVPDHPMKYRWNLPEKMPDYKVDVVLKKDGRILSLKACLEDQRVLRLCGMTNSFPDRFLREIELPIRGREFKTNYNAADKTLDVIVDKIT